MAYVCLDRRQQGFTIIELAIVTVIVGLLAGLAVPTYLGYLDKARLTRCIAEIRYISRAIDSYKSAYDIYPNTLADAGAGDIVDPWGNPYEYLNIAALTLPGNGGGNGGGGGGGNGGGNNGAWQWILPNEAYAAAGGNASRGRPRKDRFLHPINSDYDLYSMGKDGESVEPLTAQKSHDDIIRANDGSFVGLAVEF
ncbi:MAG: prepilin-type N-terminal cleavage/methylation domain-containing protein [Fimbriimonadaceae bacterium]|nr:prepilin-type N-terminal cleavage/methylation domain-containing protein [Fimbriimonadaceae bacterium]MBX3649296.1 prepilin-type N-terminal cleavage/methylation domain-containing protein [Rhodocyclaceae bacterium]